MHSFFGEIFLQYDTLHGFSAWLRTDSNPVEINRIRGQFVINYLKTTYFTGDLSINSNCFFMMNKNDKISQNSGINRLMSSRAFVNPQTKVTGSLSVSLYRRISLTTEPIWFTFTV